MALRTRRGAQGNRPSSGRVVTTPLPALARHGRVAERERIGFFAEFSAWLNSLLTGYIGTNTARIAGALEPAIVTLGVLYLMIWGYLQLAGKVEEPLVYKAPHLHPRRHPRGRASALALQRPYRRYVLLGAQHAGCADHRRLRLREHR